MVLSGGEFGRRGAYLALETGRRRAVGGDGRSRLSFSRERRDAAVHGPVYCGRIANFPNPDAVNREYEPGMNRWFSARDMAELTACCIEAPQPQFGIFYGASLGGELKWDMSNARELVGWEPCDRGAPSP